MNHFSSKSLRVKLLTVVCLRGRDWISAFFCMAILTSFHEVVGGPSSPRTENAATEDELSETAPNLLKVLAKTNGELIEVFVQGWRPSNCHSKQEILVTTEEDQTKVIIRLLKSPPPVGQVCDNKPYEFELKVADLVKTDKSSYRISVFGLKGWHTLDLSHLKPDGL